MHVLKLLLVALRKNHPKLKHTYPKKKNFFPSSPFFSAIKRKSCWQKRNLEGEEDLHFKIIGVFPSSESFNGNDFGGRRMLSKLSPNNDEGNFFVKLVVAVSQCINFTILYMGVDIIMALSFSLLRQVETSPFLSKAGSRSGLRSRRRSSRTQGQKARRSFSRKCNGFFL